MTIDPSNIKSIFLAASEKLPAERAEFLDQATAGNAALLARVEALLKAHDNPDSFLEDPAAEFGATIDLSPAEHPLAEKPGTLIGPYKLLEQIGEGGMGVVYMADQQAPVRRRVALKIIKAGMDTRQVIARFEAERQALAMMDHSNIARVLDAGATESGRPYFVMELVRGLPITEYCDQNNLPVHERLELFVQVCSAVQHAHQKGIIHRDLKPTNVLVTLNDGRAVPKVIDFGVAKATGQQLTEKTLFTSFAQMVGTPLYMSPEQAEMTSVDIDTRSDIYSLGVLLYELLTGTTPFDQDRMRSAAFDEIRRIIREEEPPKPSTRISTLGESRPATAAHRQVDAHQLSKLIKGDLDWIVMKALDKDRTRRYDTAGNFAADVLRHLSDQPVDACPPSALYRSRKFARRNKMSLAVAGLIALFLALLVGGVGWAKRDQAMRQAALVQGVTAALNDIHAWHQRENWPEAMAAVKRAEGLLSAGDLAPELAGRVRQWRASLETVARLEEIGLLNSGGDQFDVSVAGHTGYEREFRALGIDIDTQSIDDAAARIRALPIRAQLTQALDQWGQYRRNITVEATPRKWDKPDDWWRRPLAVARIADPDEVRVLVRLAVEQGDSDALLNLAKSPAARRLPGSTLRYLARETYSLVGDQDLAIKILKRAQIDHPNDFWINQTLANYLSHPQTRAPRLAESIHYWTAAVALRPQDAWTHLRLGSLLAQTGQIDEAAVVFQRAIELQPNRAESHMQLGNTLQAQGKFDEGIAASRKAIELKPDDPSICNSLAWVLSTSPSTERRNPTLAVELATRAAELAPQDGTIWRTLGVARYRAGDWQRSIEALAKSMELRGGGDASDWFFVAMDLWRLGDHPQARAWYGIAVDWTDKYYANSDEVGNFRSEAAGLIAGQSAAKSSDEQTLNVGVPSDEPKAVWMHPDAATLRAFLSRTLLRVGIDIARDKVWKYYDERLTLTRATLGPEHAQTLAAMCDLAEVCSAARRHSEAEQQYRNFLALSTDAAQIGVARRGLAISLLRQGKSEAGVEILRDLFLAKLHRLQTPDAIELREAWPRLADAQVFQDGSPRQDGLDLDGDRDYVVLPSLQFDGRPPWTVEAIVKYAELDGTIQWTRLLSTADADGGSIMLQPQQQKWEISLYTGDFFIGSERWWEARHASACARADADLAIHKWQHVAGVWDGKELRIYVDGRLQNARVQVDYCTRLSGSPFFLGANPYGWSSGDVSGGCMRGRLRAARFSRGIEYTDSFTSPERLQRTPHTIALYDFTIDTGRYAIDRSGHDNHGIIVGAKFVKADE